ncbi:hypothetical protein H6F88_12745 [Oculatella sp. FACHB-28]|uniref:hypothetical protein n=1 Tax=Oculatella sp. FACHB-28 TaxID=2692845 RepID=UPI0016850BBE|nr:hypothetical protein [Oculatella sp. FACHB-28]MBD2056870.1 hypothetical protein [Oculatella sp. FACHB-28]
MSTNFSAIAHARVFLNHDLLQEFINKVRSWAFIGGVVVVFGNAPYSNAIALKLGEARGAIAPLIIPFSYSPGRRSRVKILITSLEPGAGNNGLHSPTSAKPRRCRS